MGTRSLSGLELIKCLSRTKKLTFCYLDDTFLHLSHLKGLANDKINSTEKLKFVLGRTENIVAELQIYGAPAPWMQNFKKMSHNFSR